MPIKKEILDELLKDCKSPQDMVSSEFLRELKKAVIERAMEAEITEYLGYEKNSLELKETNNRRNGVSSKKVRTEDGILEISVPRDRESEFEPAIIAKHQREFKGFDDKILAMYARGMTTREIQGYLHEIYDIEVSPDLISRVTDSVKEHLDEWSNRTLESFYPIVFLDAIRINIRDNGQILKKAIYLALAIRSDGKKELLGLWVEQTEGSKFWLGILNELKNRGVQDILICAVDGLTGFPEAINAVFPKTEIQLCIVHMVRNSIKFVPYKDRKEVSNDLKKVYLSANAELAENALEEFSTKWNEKYPMISKSWRSRWTEVIPFLKFSPEIRKAVYTTNAIESLNYSIRKITKNRQSFPNDDAALKLIFMGLQNISKKWTMPIRDWTSAINQFVIFYGDRFPL